MKEKGTQTTDQRRDIIVRYSHGLYNALRFEKQVNEETGEGIRVVDPGSKEIADYIIERFVNVR